MYVYTYIHTYIHVSIHIFIYTCTCDIHINMYILYIFSVREDLEQVSSKYTHMPLHVCKCMYANTYHDIYIIMYINTSRPRRLAAKRQRPRTKYSTRELRICSKSATVWTLPRLRSRIRSPSTTMIV